MTEKPTIFAGVDKKTRAQLYLTVCVPTRLALYSLVLIERNHPVMPWMVGLFAILSLFHLSMSPFDVGQWWSRRFQWLISILIVFACANTIITKHSTIVIPVLLYTSVFGGLIQAGFRFH